MKKTKKFINFDPIQLFALSVLVIFLVIFTGIVLKNMLDDVGLIEHSQAKQEYYGVKLDDIWKSYDTYIPSKLINVKVETAEGKYVYRLDGVVHEIPIEQMKNSVNVEGKEQQMVVSVDSGEAISDQNYLLNDGSTELQNFNHKVKNNEKTNDIPLNVIDYEIVGQYNKSKEDVRSGTINLLALVMVTAALIMDLIEKIRDAMPCKKDTGRKNMLQDCAKQ